MSRRRAMELAKMSANELEQWMRLSKTFKMGVVRSSETDPIIESTTSSTVLASQNKSDVPLLVGQQTSTDDDNESQLAEERTRRMKKQPRFMSERFDRIPQGTLVQTCRHEDARSLVKSV